MKGYNTSGGGSMKKVLYPFLILILSTNICYADYNKDIKDLELLQNRIDILYSLLAKNIHKNNIDNELRFIHGEVDHMRNTLNNNSQSAKDLNERVKYLSAMTILNYFEIATLLGTRYYQEGEDVSDLKGGMASFYEGKEKLDTLMN